MVWIMDLYEYDSWKSNRGSELLKRLNSRKKLPILILQRVHLLARALFEVHMLLQLWSHDIKQQCTNQSQWMKTILQTVEENTV